MFRPPSWNRQTVESWGEVKTLPSLGERKKNWGRGRGRVYFSFPAPPPLRQSVILAPILPVCSKSKIAAKHSKDHQNRLHCRIEPLQECQLLCCLIHFLAISFFQRSHTVSHRNPSLMSFVPLQQCQSCIMHFLAKFLAFRPLKDHKGHQKEARDSKPGFSLYTSDSEDQVAMCAINGGGVRMKWQKLQLLIGNVFFWMFS